MLFKLLDFEKMDFISFISLFWPFSPSATSPTFPPASKAVGYHFHLFVSSFGEFNAYIDYLHC
jgi:hypothetical protein